jgi:hypothetical protein
MSSNLLRGWCVAYVGDARWESVYDISHSSVDVLIFYVLVFGIVYMDGLMQFLTADQKQQRDNVCEELRQIASGGAIFLSRDITGDESWIYGYGPETEQQSSQWKIKSKVKSMLIIFFDIRGIIHKDFVLAGQKVNSKRYCDVLR